MFFVTACQTAQRKSFDSIKVGMNKSIVVETVGGPTFTRRTRGQDRWIYEFRDTTGLPTSKEVDFEEGIAVYVGPKQTPKVSADEQDRMNAGVSADDMKNWRMDADRRDANLGTSRSSRSFQYTPSEDAIDRKIRESLYGIDPQPEIEARKQAPRFEPIQ